MNKVISFLRTSTSGHGFAVLTAALAGGGSGTMTWSEATVGIIAGIILIAWPQMSPADAAVLAKPAETLAADLLKQSIAKKFDAQKDIGDLIAIWTAVEDADAKRISAKAAK